MDEKKNKQQQKTTKVDQEQAAGQNQGDKEQRRQPNRDRTQAGDRGKQGKNREESDNAMPVPSFDEGERRPSPIESSDQGGLRKPVQGSPADPKRQSPTDEGKHTEGTMPPGEGQDPKRNTM